MADITPPVDSVARFQAMLSAHPALLWATDDTGLYTDFNDSWLNWRGRARGQECGNGWLEGVHPDDLDTCTSIFIAHFSERIPFEMEYRLRRNDGEYRLMLDTGAPWFLEAGEFIGFIGSVVDITDRVGVRHALEETEELYRATVESLHEGVVITDVKDRVLSLNNAAEILLGGSSTQMLGRRLYPRTSSPIIKETGDPVLPDAVPSVQALRSGMPVTGMVLGWALPDAPIRWHELNSRPLYRASTREVCGTVTSIIDITERKMLTDEAFHRASHDPLTGLGNRDELLTKVKSVMQRKVRTGDEVAIAFIDIDNFKAINDKYGHQAGDETLQHIATRIARAVRSGDIVARVGGDEIAVLLDQVAGLPGALRAAEKIRAAVCMPVQLNDCMFTPTVSIGVSLLDHYEELELGLSRADTAMYSAKHSGRNAVVGMDAIGSCMPIGTDDGE